MISVLIPFHNEEGNLPTLLSELSVALSDTQYEIVLVNDGSTDNSKQVVVDVQKKQTNLPLVLVSYHRRRGKGYALSRAIENAKGDIIIFMDGDGQDNPADIPLFLKKIADGYDVVNGWRKNRSDTGSMKAISKIGNSLLWRRVLGSKLQDVNCGFKAFRKEILLALPLYGDNFRFLPIFAEHEGFLVGEIEVTNRPRISGRSKYSPAKALYGVLDTVTTYFIFRFAEKPLHFFGPIGGSVFGVGFLIALYLTYERLFFGVLLYRRPALQFAILFIIIGIQIVLTGIVAELIVYLHHKMRKKGSV